MWIKEISWLLVVLASCVLLKADKPYATPQYLEMLRMTGQHEEFARHLGIEDVSLVFPREGKSSLDPMFNKDFALGDVLLTKEQIEQGRQAIDHSTYPTMEWEDGRVPYWIQKSDFTAEQLDVIYEAIRYSNSLDTHFFLVPATNEDEDYISVFSGQGCYSHLGRTGGAQALSLQANGCVVRGIVLHEILHAIGFVHEQNRPDRDQYVKIKYENIEKSWQSQYQKVSSRDYVTLVPYDYYSVMHYGMKAPGSDKPAFEILKPGINEAWIGQRQGYTRSDVVKLRRYNP